MTAEPEELLRQARMARRKLETLERHLAQVTGAPPDVERAAAVAREIQAGRRVRTEFFRSGLFGEPAWDLMLSLYRAQASSHDMNCHMLFRAAGVLPTTGSRFLDKLEAEAVVSRTPSPSDRRATSVRFTEEAFARITMMLNQIGGVRKWR